MKKTITTTAADLFPLTITITTERNYFSITGAGYRRCECLHDKIFELRPDLKPFVELHLADLDGVPMHAEANGWYWLAKAAGIPQRWEPDQTPSLCLQSFCQHVRLPNCLAILDSIKKTYQDGRNSVATNEIVSPTCEEKRINVGAAKAREFWGKLMEEMRPRWKAEAEHALKLLGQIS